jgi:glycosyl transferase/beta-hydroxylase protein BlmF
MSKPRKLISLLCPTRGRSSQAIRLALSVSNTAVHPERVEVLFYVDDNDPEQSKYLQEFKIRQSELNELGRCLLLVSEPIGVSKAWNELAARSQGDLLIMAADDQIYNDRGWDNRLDTEATKYADEIFCMWFNDGHWGEKLCTFPIVSRRWCLTLGYFTTGLFECLYDDLWIMDVAKRLGRLHYIPDVLTEHFHWSYGKAQIDATYEWKQVDATGKVKPAVQRDMNLFSRTAHYREADAKRLAALFAEPIVLQSGLPNIGKASIFNSSSSPNTATARSAEIIDSSTQKPHSLEQSDANSTRLVTLRLREKPELNFQLLLDEKAFTQKTMLTAFSQNRLYLPQESQFLMQVLQLGDSFIDIGAHVGYFALLASELVGEQGAVYAVEMEPKNYAMLLKNVQLNQRHHWHLFNVALGADPKPSLFFVNLDNDGGHALWNVGQHPHNLNSRSTQLTRTVQMETLDRLLGQQQIHRLKAIKIAVEGAEHEVLKGGRNFIQSHQVPYILCRINRFGLQKMGTTERALRNEMTVLGYQTYQFDPTSRCPVKLAPEQHPESLFVFSLLFVRSSAQMPSN